MLKTTRRIETCSKKYCGRLKRETQKFRKIVKEIKRCVNTLKLKHSRRKLARTSNGRARLGSCCYQAQWASARCQRRGHASDRSGGGAAARGGGRDPKAESAIRRVTHTDDAAARGHEKDTGGNQPTMWLPCEYDS